MDFLPQSPAIFGLPPWRAGHPHGFSHHLRSNEKTRRQWIPSSPPSAVGMPGDWRRLGRSTSSLIVYIYIYTIDVPNSHWLVDEKSEGFETTPLKKKPQATDDRRYTKPAHLCVSKGHYWYILPYTIDMF